MHSAHADRYVLISADGHCGATVEGYRPYLVSRLHDEFDAWAATFRDPWSDFESDYPVDARIGASSFETPLNWDSRARTDHLDAQGIAAEVLFPNTAPPFYPSGVISAPGPRTAEEYRLRWEGIRAHNRWLSDFCVDAPGRRAGIAQVFLDDIDDAIAEVQWAKAAGLAGVLLPSDHLLKLANLYHPDLDAFWATCAGLELPVHRHGIKITEAASDAGFGAIWAGIVEGEFFHTRPVIELLCTGVFERYPSLQFVLTEAPNASDIPRILTRLDAMYRGGGKRSGFAPAVAALRRTPSGYFSTNCFVGGALDYIPATEAGTPNLMWGADIPHAEGSSPYTVEVLRHVFGGRTQSTIRDEVTNRAMTLYRLDRRRLEDVASRIGPSVADVARPLTDSERPRFPEDTRCTNLRTERSA